MIPLLLSNNPNTYALTRAASHGIEAKVFDRNAFRETDQVLWLVEAEITHIVLMTSFG